ncbi:MAG: hypothetical protein ACRD98_00220 [Nitrososphaera sp.]
MATTRGKLQFQGLFNEVLTSLVTYNPGSLLDAAGETSAAFSVPGAALGDFVMCAAPYDLQGITVTAYVSAADSVRVRVQNESAATVDLASGSWKLIVLKPNTAFFT